MINKGKMRVKTQIVSKCLILSDVYCHFSFTRVFVYLCFVPSRSMFVRKRNDSFLKFIVHTHIHAINFIIYTHTHTHKIILFYYIYIYSFI